MKNELAAWPPRSFLSSDIDIARHVFIYRSKVQYKVGRVGSTYRAGRRPFTVERSWLRRKIPLANYKLRDIVN